MRTFVDDADRQRFLEIVGQVVEEGGWIVHAYCVMPNHYHLLCETPKGELSRWMRQLNAGYVRYFNARHRRVGHLWQGRYKAILVEDGAYFLECGRYIHLNPNRSRITRPAERYAWSSYRNYVAAGVPRAEWVETSRTLKQFGGRRDRYRKFVESGKGEKAVSPFERAVAGLVLGGEAFVQRIHDLTQGRLPSPEQPALGELRRLQKAPPDVVEKVVEALFSAEQPRRRRRLILYALRKHSRLRPSEIARRQGRSAAAVTLAVRDLEAEAHSKPELAKGLRTLARAVQRHAQDLSNPESE